jgi:hypothetical protein
MEMIRTIMKTPFPDPIIDVFLRPDVSSILENGTIDVKVVMKYGIERF